MSRDRLLIAQACTGRVGAQRDNSELKIVLQSSITIRMCISCKKGQMVCVVGMDAVRYGSAYLPEKTCPADYVTSFPT
jgi:hypothetical protein